MQQQANLQKLMRHLLWLLQRMMVMKQPKLHPHLRPQYRSLS